MKSSDELSSRIETLDEVVEKVLGMDTLSKVYEYAYKLRARADELRRTLEIEGEE